MPKMQSTPTDKLWEAAVFLQYSKNDKQKIQGSIEAEGEMDLVIGDRPNYTSQSATQTITYDYDIETGEM